jgi:mRNA-degrading endonuclease toxin of MazEF toxin-antitoxin module
MAENQIERGEVYWVYLDPVFGREIGGYKVRPVAVVSINDIHRNTRLVTVIPGTTTAINRPNVVEVTPDSSNALRETTYFQCHQIRAVDQGRMTGRATGRLSKGDLQRIEAAIRTSIGLP